MARRQDFGIGGRVRRLPSTTHHYVVADLAMKDRALARLQEPDEMIHRYHAPDSLLAFLKTLELM